MCFVRSVPLHALCVFYFIRSYVLNIIAYTHIKSYHHSPIKQANAEWGLKGKLDVDPSDIPNWAPDYGFGTQVALSGSTAIVGSRKRDNNGLGSARVFVRESGGLGWDQQALLVGNDGDATHEYFGYAVALDGDTGKLF